MVHLGIPSTLFLRLPFGIAPGLPYFQLLWLVIATKAGDDI